MIYSSNVETIYTADQYLYVALSDLACWRINVQQSNSGLQKGRLVASK